MLHSFDKKTESGLISTGTYFLPSISPKAPSEEKAVEAETPATEIPKPEEAEESFGKGIVFYTREKKVVGILLWNIFSQMPIARKIVTEGKDHEDFNTLVKAFKLH